MRLRNVLLASTMLVAGSLIGAATQHFASADVTSGDRPVLVPIETCRIADTRAAPNTVGPKSSPLAAADTMTVSAQQAGTDCVGKIPPTASALSLNVTALNATSNSFLTIWPEGPRPTASALNPEPGTRVFNAVTTELTATQTFEIYNNRGNVDVFVDINGYYDNHNHDDRYYTQAQVDSHTHDYPVGKVETILQLGQHSTPSMSFVNVPGTSLTAVTPANGRLLVTFSSEVLCLDNAPGGPTPWCFVQVLVDGAPIQPDRVIFAAGDPDGNAWNSRSHQFVSDPLAAGTHTVQARYRVDDAGAVFNVDQTILSVLPLAP